MITFENWEIRAFGGLAQQYDNLSRRLEVLGDLPQGWDWTMLVQVDDHMDLIPLSPMEGGIGADLSREQLALAGIYQLQLRGSQGDRVRHTNTEYVQVFHSLSGDVQWPEIPTQFTQLEQRIQEVNIHPPIPGENGFWLVWDVEKDKYIESEYPLPSGNGSGSTGADGGYYIPGVDETTGLLTFTPSKEDMPAVAAKNVRGPQGEQGETGPKGDKGDKGDTGSQGPAGVNGKDGAGLDVTGASVGQIARIAAVDENGVPTLWEPVDLPEGSGYHPMELLYEITLTEDITEFEQELPPCDVVELHLLNFSETAIPGDTFHRVCPNKTENGSAVTNYPIKLAKAVSSGGSEEAVYRFTRHNGFIDLLSFVSSRNSGNGNSPRGILHQTMWQVDRSSSVTGGTASFAYTDRLDYLHFTGLTLAAGVIIRIYGKKQ